MKTVHKELLNQLFCFVFQREFNELCLFVFLALQHIVVVVSQPGSGL